jgi:hypothetical protein
VIDKGAPGSPGWWFHRLGNRLMDRRLHYDALWSYYEGTNGIPVHAAKSVRESYRRLMAISRTNFAELVVEAVRERMMPTAFRTGAESDDAGDDEAWRIWQANALDADCAEVHRMSLVMGMAYAMVGPVDGEIDAPVITPEDPREVVAEMDPRRARRVRAALKLYRDDTAGVDRAVLFARDASSQVWFFAAVKRSEAGSELGFDGDWDWSQQAVRVPQMPIVAFPNGTGNRSMGEFERHIALLDRINFTLLSRVEIATLQAFRQRAVKGVPTHDADGNEVNYDDIFAMDPGALWLLPASAELWESGQVDLGPLRQAIRDDVQDLAAVTRTPLFYLTPEAANGSAEGASLAREGLVFKTSDRIVQAGESWEQVMSTAFAFAGDEVRARRPDMEVLWASPERFSLAERYDAAVKAQAAGVPWRTVMTSVLQYSPQEVERMQAERATDVLLSPPQPGVAA